MLAAFGLCVICLRVRGSLRLIFILLVVVSYAAGLSAQRYIWRTQTSYADHHLVAGIARRVDEVTSATGLIFAFEAVYFAAHRLPPPGLENRFNPASPANEWLRSGRFDTVCIGASDPRLDEFGLLERYAKHETVSMNGQTLYILWEKKLPTSAAAKKRE